MEIPQELCPKHCGKKGENCNTGKKGQKCYMIKGATGYFNWTCGKTHHGIKHFLLCEWDDCREKSERYWDKKTKKEISLLVARYSST